MNQQIKTELGHDTESNTIDVVQHDMEGNFINGMELCECTVENVDGLIEALQRLRQSLLNSQLAEPLTATKH